MASLSDVRAPAPSLATACAGLRRRAARKGIAAGAIRSVRAAIPPLPRACPATRPKRCSSGSSRSPASARRGPLRSPPRLRPRSVGDRRPSSRSSRAPRPVGPHLARPFALGGSPPLCRGIRSGRAGFVAALLSRRPVARCALLPPVPRPARARVLARALAALLFSDVQLLNTSARVIFLRLICL